MWRFIASWEMVWHSSSSILQDAFCWDKTSPCKCGSAWWVKFAPREIASRPFRPTSPKQRMKLKQTPGFNILPNFQIHTSTHTHTHPSMGLRVVMKHARRIMRPFSQAFCRPWLSHEGRICVITFWYMREPICVNIQTAEESGIWDLRSGYHHSTWRTHRSLPGRTKERLLWRQMVVS